MNPIEKFLKVEITAYFPIDGLNIETRQDEEEPEHLIYYLNGKRLEPNIVYNYLVKDNEGNYKEVDLPEFVEFNPDMITSKESIVTRQEIWDTDSSAKFLDEFLEKTEHRKRKPKEGTRYCIKSQW